MKTKSSGDGIYLTPILYEAKIKNHRLSLSKQFYATLLGHLEKAVNDIFEEQFNAEIQQHEEDTDMLLHITSTRKGVLLMLEELVFNPAIVQTHAEWCEQELYRDTQGKELSDTERAMFTSSLSKESMEQHLVKLENSCNKHMKGDKHADNAKFSEAIFQCLKGVASKIRVTSNAPEPQTA